MKQRDPAVTRVLVTGATGFLGRRILGALRDQGVEAVAACRDRSKLPDGFHGEVRLGDLTDAGYRAAVVQGVDAVCHAGTWGAFWGHAKQERELFLTPALDLLEQGQKAGVGRFLLASTVAVADRGSKGSAIDDFAPSRKTGFWPHVDALIDVDRRMQEMASPSFRTFNMRLGHFVGQGNSLGLVPAIIPRLKTRLVPWLGMARARMPLVTAEDMGQAFALAATVEGLQPYESFNIHSGALPTIRQVISHIAREARVPAPLLHAPYWSGYVFGRLMEALPTPTPFLTRSIVHVSEDWNCPIDHARDALGYAPKGDWRQAVAESVAERRKDGFRWPALNQAIPATAN
ncbi:NAD-dependent epimerase/dehydratase family protein [Neogemmobacter tilapiae]|uniref:dTDP-4-dehydrorhamnose 3,5-epimerase n=1 Tax=Neogemmobacter tilapiae TaxID=875041 RepID=A0A918WH98_9RHOB|nr:NAD-dependent epimerase/dehydratase family protein [Gemmobacter tilapiae]GHC46404.1 dTDP-4-dehydrorhamnose 3,5-epimerase [Gemmobacter tilapiae]